MARNKKSDGDGASSRRRSLGVRSKLFMSFGAIVALTVLAVGISLFAFKQVRTAFDVMVQNDMPAIVNSARLAMAGTNVTVFASRLVNAREEDLRQAESAKLRAAVDELTEVQKLIGEEDGESEEALRLEAKTASFASMLDELDTYTKATLEQTARVKTDLAKLFSEYEAIVSELAPRTDDAYFELMVGAETAGGETGKIVDQIVNKDMQSLRLMLELRGAAQAMTGAVSSYLLVESAAVSKLFEDKMVAASSRLKRLLAALAETDTSLQAGGELMLLSELGGEAQAMRNAATFDAGAPATVQMLSQLIETQQLIDNAMVAAIDDRLFTLTLDAEEAAGANAAVIRDLLDNQVGNLKSTLEAVSAVHQFVAIVVQGALTDDADMIVPLQDKVIAAGAELRSSASDHVGTDVRDQVEALLAHGDPQTGVLPEREKALSAIASANYIVARVFTAAQDIGEETKQLIAGHTGEMAERTDSIAGLFDFGGMALMIIGLVSAGVAVLIGLLVVDRGIAKPLGQLAEATKAISEGDLTTRIPDNSAGGEIGNMVDALRVFRDSSREREQLQETSAAEQQAREKRQAQVEQLIAEFRTNVQQALEMVAENANQMQATAEALSSVAEETSAEAHKATLVTSDSSSSVQTVASASEEMAASIGEIARQVAASTEVVERATANAGTTNVKISALAEAAQRIGDVVGMISDIADQTNLLALNATIEAARAGEAGRGFAIVAAEVKELASQTGSATEEIANQIASIQASTKEAVESIALITHTMEEVDRYTAAIAGAVDQQRSATTEISGNALKAAEGTNSLSETMGRVSHTVAETNQSAAQMLSSSADVNKQAEDLRHTIDRFLSDVAAA